MSKKYSLTISELQDLRNKGHLLLDLRSPEEFAKDHIPGSLNIELNENFLSIAKYFIFKDQAIVINTEKGKGEDNISKLFAHNYNNLGGYLEEGLSIWCKNNKAIDLVISIDIEELSIEIKHSNMILYDLRPKEDFQRLHVEGSQNIKIDDLLDDFELIDNKNPTCIYCSDGQLSMSMISFLKINGKNNLYHVSGGFERINQEKSIPLIKNPK